MTSLIRSAVDISLKPITALGKALAPSVPAPKAPAPPLVAPLPDEEELKRNARRATAERRGSRLATTALNQVAGGTGERLGP